MRLFTLDEANALLDRLRPLVEALWERRRDLAIAQLENEVRAAPRGHAPGIRVHEDEIVRLIERIEHFGCIVKDIDLGLIDFPSTRGGRTIYLCWKADEPAVAHWHDLDSGFSGRRPLA
ncbi:MAG: DUF2203 domain-containing protein [bacterium]|nr:DUF2203 domain-containing protein [bacterium]